MKRWRRSVGSISPVGRSSTAQKSCTIRTCDNVVLSSTSRIRLVARFPSQAAPCIQTPHRCASNPHHRWVNTTRRCSRSCLASAPMIWCSCGRAASCECITAARSRRVVAGCVNFELSYPLPLHPLKNSLVASTGCASRQASPFNERFFMEWAAADSRDDDAAMQPTYTSDARQNVRQACREKVVPTSPRVTPMQAFDRHQKP
jgi:hypothetical protein